jgi:hypothetical protein
MFSNKVRKALIRKGVKMGKFTEETAVMSTSSIIALLVGAVFVSALLPTIIKSLTNMNTTGWGTTETTLVSLLPLFIVIGIIGKFSNDL